MKLHQTIKNFYIRSIKPLFSIEVLSENGWNKIQSFNITEKQIFYKIKAGQLELLCTKNHILIDENNNEILACKSLGHYIKTKNGIQLVTSVEKSNKKDHAYDLSLNNDHLYYCNGMLSHNCVIMDEAAFVPNNVASRVFESIYPVISSSKNSQFIMVSTPNGADPNNLYYSIWQKANQKVSDKNSEGWKAFRFDWWDVPGRDEQWKINTIASIGERRFAQEFGNEFLSGSGSKKLIPDDVIERFRIRLTDYKNNNIKPKECKILAETEDKMFKFDMWHEFRKDRTYCATGDVAEGVGGDDSVLYIWDVTNLSDVRMCAKFSSNCVSLVEFAFVAARMLRLYGEPPLFCERNGVSAGMLDSLRITYGYGNIPQENKKGEPGIYSHVSVKTTAELWTREMLTTDGFGFTIYDKDLIDEMGTFVKKDNKGVHTVFSAANGAHDDHLMSLVWLCYALASDLNGNDIIDKYFVVCQNFNSVFGKQYPRILMPMKPYDPATLKAVSEDPIYNDFVDFKSEGQQRNKTLTEAFAREDAADTFRYMQPDPYFGGMEEGPSWNSPYSGGSIDQRNPNNRMPVFFI